MLIVDDQPLFREGLRTLLSVHRDLDIVGEASNGLEAVSEVLRLAPSVVLMDLRMPHLDGVSATRRIRQSFKDCAVIVLTTFDDDELVFDGLRAGAMGYLLKDAPSERIAEAIRGAARGESFLQPSIAAKVVAEFSRLAKPSRVTTTAPMIDPLSIRELDVLRLLAAGASNREIAAALSLAEGTVKNHVTNVLSKLGVRDRTQAALRAVEERLV